MTSTAEIGYFRVTNRGFERQLEALDITKEEIDTLPVDAKIAEIGSGLDQNFARGIMSIRPDVKVISLDPTLGLAETDFSTTHGTGEAGQLTDISYHKGRPEFADEVDEQRALTNRRLHSAKVTGNVVAGLAPELPFADQSLDMIIDSWGPCLYLDRYKKDSPLEDYLKNIARILKSGGVAHLYPIEHYGEDLKRDIRNKKAKGEYQGILKEINDVEFEFIERQDRIPSIGVKIRKL